MYNLFELTEAKKLSRWMIIVSILLFALSASIHFFRLFDAGQSQLLVGGHWLLTQLILIFAALIFGTILFLIGISLRMLCNNVSRLMKSYDEKMYKRLAEKQ